MSSLVNRLLLKLIMRRGSCVVEHGAGKQLTDTEYTSYSSHSSNDSVVAGCLWQSLAVYTVCELTGWPTIDSDLSSLHQHINSQRVGENKLPQQKKKEAPSKLIKPLMISWSSVNIFLFCLEWEHRDTLTMWHCAASLEPVEREEFYPKY